MGIGKQSKTLNKNQIEMVSTYLRSKRNGLRNQTIFLLSVKSGLRAKEIASLQWRMVVQPDGKIDDYINLPNSSSKGRSGRVIPLHSSLKINLNELLEEQSRIRTFDLDAAYVVRTEHSASTSAQSIVNMFSGWYRDLGLIGCSSHSGRRTWPAPSKWSNPNVRIGFGFERRHAALPL